MMRIWFYEFWRLIAFLFPGFLLGLWLDSVILGLFIGLALYQIWQYNQARRVYFWMGSGRRSQPLNATGIWSEFVDITYRLYRRDRKRKKKIVRILNRFYESLSALPDAAVILNQEHDIEWFNKAARDLLGLQKEDLGGRISNLLRDPGFTTYLSEGRYRQAIEISSPCDERIWLSLRIVPFGKKQYLLLARDVSHIRQLERMREDFVANVSHELRTPLTVIAGYLETLTEPEYADDIPAPVFNSLKQMKGQSMRMQRLVEDLLQLSRLETDLDTEDHMEVSIPAILAAVEEEAKVMGGEKGQTIQSEVDDTLWLLGDPRELHSAFSNLVSNAVRYTPEGGAIIIRWYHDAHGAHFEVEDNGIGIEPHHVQRLTERFYRVDKDRSRMNGGTGLGLAIVKHVLQRHEGTLHISSQAGSGSVFRCDFPVSQAVTHHAPEVAVTKTS
jgi:two-component system phosphate regulon sensor histidine kinase PhoR